MESQLEFCIIYFATGDSYAGIRPIRVEYRGTLHDSKYSAEEIEINEKYKSFLNEAYSVVTVYSQGQTPDLSKMKAAKAELY